MLKFSVIDVQLASAMGDSHQTITTENDGTHFQAQAELHFSGLARPFG